MKKILKKILIGSLLTFSVIGLVGCNEKPKSAFEIYDEAYENTIAENNITLNDIHESEYTTANNNTDTSKAETLFKKNYNTQEDYKLSFKTNTSINDESAVLEGYVENNKAYINQNGDKFISTVDYNSLLTNLVINYVNIAEESIKSQSFEKNKTGGYDVVIRLDKDKFTELLATKYKSIDEAYLISNSFDVDEVTITASTNKEKKFNSTNIEIKGSQPLDEKGENVNIISIKHLTTYSDYGSTVIEKPEDADKYEEPVTSVTETPNEAKAEANDAPIEMQTN